MKKILLIVMILDILSVQSVLYAADVVDTYKRRCVVCHGIDGKGYTKVGQKLNIKDFTIIELKDNASFNSIKNGIKKDNLVLMRPVEFLTDDEIKALVVYVKTFYKK